MLKSNLLKGGSGVETVQKLVNGLGTGLVQVLIPGGELPSYPKARYQTRNASVNIQPYKYIVCKNAS